MEGDGCGEHQCDLDHPLHPPAEAVGVSPPHPPLGRAGWGRAGLELIVVARGRRFRWWLWAGGRCHQLHEVLAAAGLRGASHHCLLPTQQAHLGRVAGRRGSGRLGGPGSPVLGPPTGHSQ